MALEISWMLSKEWALNKKLQDLGPEAGSSGFPKMFDVSFSRFHYRVAKLRLFWVSKQLSPSDKGIFGHENGMEKLATKNSPMKLFGEATPTARTRAQLEPMAWARVVLEVPKKAPTKARSVGLADWKQSSSRPGWFLVSSYSHTVFFVCVIFDFQDCRSPVVSRLGSAYQVEGVQGQCCSCFPVAQIMTSTNCIPLLRQRLLSRWLSAEGWGERNGMLWSPWMVWIISHEWELV